MEKPRKKRTPFGVRLVQARKAAGLTQAQLAKQVGMLQSALSEAENNNAGSLHIAKMAKVLNVNSHWLETGEGLREIQNQPDLTNYMLPGTPALSASALELAALFDLLTERVSRAQAYVAATQSILHVLQLDAPPKPEPKPPGPEEKPRE